MRIFLTIIAIFFLISCADNPKTDQALGETTNIKEALQSSQENNIVAKVDTSNQRVFVVIDSSLASDIKQISVIIKQVDSLYIFKTDLNVSFVSSRKYAGYKDELEMNKSISYAEFYSNYLGEYNKMTKVYWTYPALPGRKVKYRID